MRLSKSIVLFCAILILSPSLVFAQGALLDKGQSGFGTQIGYAQGPESNVLQGTFVGTAVGLIDIGFFIGSINNDRRGSRTSVGFITELYLVREDTNQTVPLNLSIFFQYGSAGAANLGTIGISVFKKMAVSRYSYKQPYLSLAKTWSSGFAERGEFVIEFGFTFAGKKGNSKIFSFTPSIAKIKDDIFIGLSLGFTFPLQPQDQAKDEWDF